MKKVIDGYAKVSADLIARYEAIASEDVFAPVQAYLPTHPCRILDIGAGTGRDAAWFARAGHRVVAVEPVDAFRAAGQTRHSGLGIEWVDDTLPELYAIAQGSETFDCIIMAAVWQHLTDRERRSVFGALKHIASGGGTVILSIRQGESAPGRETYLARVSDVALWAKQAGFAVIAETTAPSTQLHNQDAGVTWVWVVLKARG